MHFDSFILPINLNDQQFYFTFSCFSVGKIGENGLDISIARFYDRFILLFFSFLNAIHINTDKTKLTKTKLIDKRTDHHKNKAIMRPTMRPYCVAMVIWVVVLMVLVVVVVKVMVVVLLIVMIIMMMMIVVVWYSR